MSAVRVSYELEAAFGKLLPRLKELKRGDDLTDEECDRLTGIKTRPDEEGSGRLDARIRTFFWRMKISVTRRNDALHVMTSEEQVGQSRKHRDRGHRQNVRQFVTARGAERSELTPVSKAIADLLERRALAKLQTDEDERKEHKALLGAPEPLPRLKG